MDWTLEPSNPATKLEAAHLNSSQATTQSSNVTAGPMTFDTFSFGQWQATSNHSSKSSSSKTPSLLLRMQNGSPATTISSPPTPTSPNEMKLKNKTKTFGGAGASLLSRISGMDLPSVVLASLSKKQRDAPTPSRPTAENPPVVPSNEMSVDVSSIDEDVEHKPELSSPPKNSLDSDVVMDTPAVPDGPPTLPSPQSSTAADVVDSVVIDGVTSAHAPIGSPRPDSGTTSIGITVFPDEPMAIPVAPVTPVTPVIPIPAVAVDYDIPNLFRSDPFKGTRLKSPTPLERLMAEVEMQQQEWGSVSEDLDKIPKQERIEQTARLNRQLFEIPAEVVETPRSPPSQPQGQPATTTNAIQYQAKTAVSSTSRTPEQLVHVEVRKRLQADNTSPGPKSQVNLAKANAQTFPEASEMAHPTSSSSQKTSQPPTNSSANAHGQKLSSPEKAKRRESTSAAAPPNDAPDTHPIPVFIAGTQIQSRSPTRSSFPIAKPPSQASGPLARPALSSNATRPSAAPISLPSKLQQTSSTSVSQSGPSSKSVSGSNSNSEPVAAAATPQSPALPGPSRTAHPFPQPQPPPGIPHPDQVPQPTTQQLIDAAPSLNTYDLPPPSYPPVETQPTNAPPQVQHSINYKVPVQPSVPASPRPEAPRVKAEPSSSPHDGKSFMSIEVQRTAKREPVDRPLHVSPAADRPSLSLVYRDSSVPGPKVEPRTPSAAPETPVPSQRVSDIPLVANPSPTGMTASSQHAQQPSGSSSTTTALAMKAVRSQQHSAAPRVVTPPRPMVSLPSTPSTVSAPSKPTDPRLPKPGPRPTAPSPRIAAAPATTSYKSTARPPVGKSENRTPASRVEDATAWPDIHRGVQPQGGHTGVVGTSNASDDSPDPWNLGSSSTWSSPRLPPSGPALDRTGGRKRERSDEASRDAKSEHNPKRLRPEGHSPAVHHQSPKRPERNYAEPAGTAPWTYQPNSPRRPHEDQCSREYDGRRSYDYPDRRPSPDLPHVERQGWNPVYGPPRTHHRDEYGRPGDSSRDRRWVQSPSPGRRYQVEAEQYRERHRSLTPERSYQYSPRRRSRSPAPARRRSISPYRGNEYHDRSYVAVDRRTYNYERSPPGRSRRPLSPEPARTQAPRGRPRNYYDEQEPRGNTSSRRSASPPARRTDAASKMQGDLQTAYPQSSTSASLPSPTLPHSMPLPYLELHQQPQSPPMWHAASPTQMQAAFPVQAPPSAIANLPTPTQPAAVAPKIGLAERMWDATQPELRPEQGASLLHRLALTTSVHEPSASEGRKPASPQTQDLASRLDMGSKPNTSSRNPPPPRKPPPLKSLLSRMR